MNPIVAFLAIIAALDVPQRCSQLRAARQAERRVVAVGMIATASAIAGPATPLLDALDISAPNMQIGAGVVLAIYSMMAIVRWTDDPAPAALAGGLVPLLFPIVLTPAVGVVVLAVSARNGLVLSMAAIAAGAVPLGWAGVDHFLGRRAPRMLSATVGVVIGVAMIVDGAFAV